MDLHCRELMVIEAGTAHFRIIQWKSQWFDQMKMGSCIGT